MLAVEEDSDLMIITQDGKIIRLESGEIRQAGRSTQGVRLVRLEEGDRVAAASVIPSEAGRTGTRTAGRAGQPRAAVSSAASAIIQVMSAFVGLGNVVDYARRRGSARERAEALPNPAGPGRGDRSLLGRHRFGLSGAGRPAACWARTPWPSRPIRPPCPNRTSATPRSSPAASGCATSTSRPTSSTTRSTPPTTPDRCFHCKDELFQRLEEVGRERGIPNIVYGVNVDDLGDYRPGQNAAAKHDVKAPLVEAGLAQGRDPRVVAAGGAADLGPAGGRLPELAHSLRHAGHDRDGEDRRAAAKRPSRRLGFRQFRVRFHGDLVRIEIAPEEMDKALTLEMARTVHRDLQASGLPLRHPRPGGLPAGAR